MTRTASSTFQILFPFDSNFDRNRVASEEKKNYYISSSFAYCYHLVSVISFKYQGENKIVLLLHAVSSSFAYCYHLVNLISLGLAQSDLIKRHLLYFFGILNKISGRYITIIEEWAEPDRVSEIY